MKEKLLERKGQAGQLLLAFLSIVVACGLVAFLFWYRQSEADRLKSLASEVNEYEEQNQQKEQWQVSARENLEATSEAESTVEDLAEENAESVPTEAAGLKDGMVFSLRGDGFYAYRTTTGDTSIAALLQKRLEELGYQVTVEDYTLDTAGSLTHLQHAGVPGEEIQAYIDAHTVAANGERIADTERLLRVETQAQLARDDQDAFPIIGIGYKGGFGGNIDELIEQQEKILATYNHQDEYLILGYYPESFDTDEEKAAYDEAMTARWGVHYLNIEEALAQSADATTAEVRTAISEAIANRLTEQ